MPLAGNDFHKENGNSCQQRRVKAGEFSMKKLQIVEAGLITLGHMDHIKPYDMYSLHYFSVLLMYNLRHNS